MKRVQMASWQIDILLIYPVTLPKSFWQSPLAMFTTDEITLEVPPVHFVAAPAALQRIK